MISSAGQVFPPSQGPFQEIQMFLLREWQRFTEDRGRLWGYLGDTQMEGSGNKGETQQKLEPLSSYYIWFGVEEIVNQEEGCVAAWPNWSFVKSPNSLNESRSLERMSACLSQGSWSAPSPSHGPWVFFYRQKLEKSNYNSPGAPKIKGRGQHTWTAQGECECRVKCHKSGGSTLRKAKVLCV